MYMAENESAKRILTLERKFFSHQYISDKTWLAQILYDDFLECGKSGILFHKADTIRDLLACKQDRKIEIYNYGCCRLDTNSWIAHYITLSAQDEKYFRTSVWRNENGLQLFFHQATLLCMDVILKKAI